MNQPEGNAELQYTWSKCRSDNIRNGAKSRVRETIGIVEANGMDVGRVLVIGPQHGFELEEFRDCGITELVAIDVVPDFVADCTDLGFRCEHIPAERMTEVIEGKWNIYAHHCLEHCYDIRAAIEQIQVVLDQWCLVGVPIEPVPGRDVAHLSRITSAEEIRGLLEPLECITLQQTRTGFRGLFHKSTSGKP